MYIFTSASLALKGLKQGFGQKQRNNSTSMITGICLKTNILYYTEHPLSNYWFYDPVM